MKTQLICLTAVLMLGTLTACDDTTSKSDGFTISGNQEGQDPATGSSACDPNKKVRIQVAVSGGAQGNTFTVNAFCDGAFLGSASATDPGTGTSGTDTKTHQQVAGNGSCSPMTTASPTWSYICDFNM